MIELCSIDRQLLSRSKVEARRQACEFVKFQCHRKRRLSHILRRKVTTLVSLFFEFPWCHHLTLKLYKTLTHKFFPVLILALVWSEQCGGQSQRKRTNRNRTQWLLCMQPTGLYSNVGRLPCSFDGQHEPDESWIGVSAQSTRR